MDYINSILETKGFKNFNIRINALLIQYPLFFTIIIGIVGIFTSNNEYFKFIGIIKFSDLLNIVFKFISKIFLPDNITERPKNNGIIYKDIKLGNSVLPFIDESNNTKIKLEGFPSGHAQFIGLTTTIMILYIYNKTEKNKTKWYKNYRYYILIFIGILVLWQRWYSNCHTPLQIIIGTIIGIGIGIGSWEIYENHM